ncbi:MAG: cell division protein SepF [Clostridiales bacterium]|nr:cell division protein SepF [Clostridiales bacterium]
MDFRSMLDQVKSAFVIGKNNPFLHGRQGGRSDDQGYREEAAYQAPQQAYAQGNPGYQAYQAPHQQAAAPYQQQEAYGQPAWQQPDPFQQPYAPQQPPQQGYAYQAPEAQQPAWQQPPPAQQPPTFQTQIQPDPFRAEGGRNRRSQQHQAAQQQPPQQAPYAPPQQAENVVPFPGVHQQPEGAGVDAYVINVFNINTCRQAMSCLRKGQCTLIVMDQLIDKAEIRRYVDMLTGACYALNGTMTRLSAKIGFYIMAPAGMTVYTDPTTSNANAQPKPQQAPLYHAPTTPGSAPQRASDFSAQGPYGAVPQMNFSAHQAEPQQPAPPQQDMYQSWQPEGTQQAQYPYAQEQQRYAQ